MLSQPLNRHFTPGTVSDTSAFHMNASASYLKNKPLGILR